MGSLRHAIVIGGMLAAGILSDHYERVTLWIPTTPVRARTAGGPQGSSDAR